MTSSTGGSHPNRPYYTPSDESAAFVATAPRFSSNSSTGTNAGKQRSFPSTLPAGAGSVPLLPTSNRYSSSSAFDDVGSESGSYASQLSDASKALFLSAAFQYTSTCLAMPFEVGKLLLQIQWVPKDEVWIAFGEMEQEDEMEQMDRRGGSRGRRARVRGTTEGARPIGRNEWNEGEDEDEDSLDDIAESQRQEWQDDEGDDDALDELSDEEEAEAYFRDLSNTSSRSANLDHVSGKKRRKATDSHGYVMRKSIHEDGTRPDFVMPVVVRGGVWEMIKAVGRGKEGWLGLWKGA